MMGRLRTTLCVLLLCFAFSCAEELAQYRLRRQACGQFKFQCNNGECIDNTKVCDGTVDCSDKSDENQATCQTTRCPDSSFHCSYGACVSDVSKCDGKQDCADNSDELLLECPNVPKPAVGACPARKFYCGSGECIDDFLLCDGAKNCADGSDETLLQCSVKRCQGAFFRCAYGACVPKTAQCNGTVQCEGDGSDEAVELCGATAVPLCPSLVHDSLDITCYSSNGQRIPCDKAMSVGSKAEIRCKSNFVKTVEYNYPDLKCTSNGTWNNQPFTCVPECGKAFPRDQTFALNYEFVKAGEFPWQTGIFLKEGDEYVHICSGTIIKRNLILTAAHCFQKSVNPADYKVAAGKFHRSWKIIDKPEQRFDVDSIVLKDTYEGATRNYADDIAIMILKSEVTVTDFIRPICVDLYNQYVNLQLSDGINGSIAGWGNTQDNVQSEDLLTTNMPYMTFPQCFVQLPASFRPFFTHDKFCARFISGSGFCRIDSGAGLAFEQEITATKKQWFVQGIVSLGVPIRQTEEFCSKQKILFTRVSSHVNWLKKYYNEY